MTYLRMAGQFLVILLLFAGAAVLSDWPRYQQLAPNQSLIVLSFVHGADRRAECRKLTAEELAKLPPNMRRTQDCPRGRRPLHVEFDLDGRLVYRATLQPTGIAGDGPSVVYQKFVSQAGRHELAVRMRDSVREGFDYERRGTIDLRPEQVFVIDFNAERRDFVFR